MPFTCSICSMDIAVGETMLSDEKMNLAHEVCIRKGRKPPPSPVPLPPQVKLTISGTGGSGFGNPTASIEPCLMPSCSPKLCVECGKPCIAMCPSPCLKYVHQDYGYAGANCSGRHEMTCATARASREPSQKQVAPLALKPEQIFDTMEIVSVRRNGNHEHASPKKTRRARR